MQKNILEYLERTVVRSPCKLAYSNGSFEITFEKVLSLSKQIGSAILNMGYAHAPVAILMKKHPLEITAFYGAVYAGCFYVPMDPDMPPSRMESILNSVGARLLITDNKCEKIARSLHFSGNIALFDEISASEINENALTLVREGQIDTDPIYVVFTSGSTGVPKGVVACHRSVIDYTEALSEALHFSEENIFANQTPLFFDAPLKELMPGIKFGATVYLVPKMLFSFPTRLCDFLNEHRINTVCWVVSAFTIISSLGVLATNPPKYLTTVAFGSEVFPRRQYDLWREALPKAKFYNLYGPTEATGMSTYWPCNRALAEEEAIPVGNPFQNTDLFLVNEEGTLANAGETGEIYLRGTCVTMGYYNNPEKTAEAFVQNPLQNAYPELVYRTGDLGYFNPYGELVFVSRRDAQIKHMGHRIELGEIEAAACRDPYIDRACARYDADRRQIILFYTGNTSEGDCAKTLSLYLPRYMMPAFCVRLSKMPLTPNGKLDRRALDKEIKKLFDRK